MIARSDDTSAGRHDNGAMAELVAPTTLARESFVAAMAELRAEGRFGPDDRSLLSRDHWRHGRAWHTPHGFERYLQRLAAEAEPLGPVPRQRPVTPPTTTLWWLDGDEFLGVLTIRADLTPALHVDGGHIGYDVRPSARRRGHATSMLTAALPVARRLGIEQALLTCDEHNVASRKVIEACGGIPAERLGEPLRFLVPTDSFWLAVTSA